MSNQGGGFQDNRYQSALWACCVCRKTRPLFVKKAGQRVGTRLHAVLTWNSATARRVEWTGKESGAGRARRSTRPDFLRAFLRSQLCVSAWFSRWFMTVKRHRRKHDRARKEAASDRGGCSVCLYRWVATLALRSLRQHGSTTGVNLIACAWAGNLTPKWWGNVKKLARWRTRLPNQRRYMIWYSTIHLLLHGPLKE